MNSKSLHNNRVNKRVVLWALVAVSALTAAIGAMAQKELNPKFFYYVNGKLIGGWNFYVSDPGNWAGVRAENLKATSKDEKVTIQPTDYVGKNDAVLVEWTRKKEKGVFGLNGGQIDLASAKDAAAVAFDIKIEKAPNKGVQIGIDCGYPCRAEFEIGATLRESPVKKWFSLPIPLNCFKSDNFDLSKITGPLMLATDGKMKLSLANIRLERLPEGDKGCAK